MSEVRLIDSNELEIELTKQKAHLMDKAYHTTIESDRLMYMNTATGLLHAINILHNAPTVELNDKSLEIARKSIELGRKVGKLEGKLEKTQGEWICDYRYLDCTCSICNSYALERGDYPELSPYCPQCGARMKNEKTVKDSEGD